MDITHTLKFQSEHIDTFLLESGRRPHCFLYEYRQTLSIAVQIHATTFQNAYFVHYNRLSTFHRPMHNEYTVLLNVCYYFYLRSEERRVGKECRLMFMNRW